MLCILLSPLSVRMGLVPSQAPAVSSRSRILATAAPAAAEAAPADDATATKTKVVMKFGGSSVRDAERITEVCNLVVAQIAAGYSPHLVCSAMGKTTNNLLQAADTALVDGTVDLSAVRELHTASAAELGVTEDESYAEVLELLDECERTLGGVAMIGELSTKTRDRIVSFGERMSGRMVAAQLRSIGVPATQFESWDLGLVTTSKFGDASVLDSSWPTIKTSLDDVPDETVAVITGFIGKDEAGAITTLGRGGSDLTASLIGAAAGYDEVQVWKDVDGILTADPRVCAKALPVSRVSFEEAAELAYFGAQVLHPVAMQPAMRVGMPVRVKNSYNWEAPGTLITGAQDEDAGLVSAITSKSNVAMIDISSTRMLGSYGFLAKVFSAFDRNKLSVDVIASSEVSVSLTLNKNSEILSKVQDGPMNREWAATADNRALEGLVADLAEVADLSLSNGRSIVTLIANVKRSSSVMAVVFEVLDALDVQVEMLSQGASKVNISFVVPGDKEKQVIQALHACFFEDACLVPMH